MQTFKFEELTDTAKEKARRWYNTATDNHWAEYVIEYAKEEGLKRGFNIEDIFWSGFSSQGDGASWTGHIDIRKFLEYHLLDKPDNPLEGRYAVLIDLLEDGWLDSRMAVSQRNYHYVHSGGMEVEEVPHRLDYRPNAMRLEFGILAGAMVSELIESFNIESLCDHLQEWAQDEARSYADDVYKQLVEAYDYEISDEHIQETADINGWRFEEDGTFV